MRIIYEFLIWAVSIGSGYLAMTYLHPFAGVGVTAFVMNILAHLNAVHNWR